MEKFQTSFSEFNPIALFASYSTGILFVTVIRFWHVVGVMRSAINYTNNPTKTKFWGYLAIFLILVGITLDYVRYKNDIVPTAVEYYRIAILSDPDIPPYKLTVVEQGQELRIDGGIKYGLLEDAKRTLALAPSITTINLESTGGRFGVAIDLYNLLSELGLNTVTNGECLSACAIIFAAGKNRWIGIDGRLGFHSSTFANLSDDAANAYKYDMYMKINRERGIPISFLEKGDVIPSEEMWYPTREELLKNNFITSEISPALSSLKSLERTLVMGMKEQKKELPIRLDQHTILIDIHVKLNRITTIHTLSENMINELTTHLDRERMKDSIIKRSCQYEGIRYEQKSGILRKLVYLHPVNKSEFLSFEMPLKCL